MVFQANYKHLGTCNSGKMFIKAGRKYRDIEVLDKAINNKMKLVYANRINLKAVN